METITNHNFQGLAFFSDRLFYADSAFDSIDVATIIG